MFIDSWDGHKTEKPPNDRAVFKKRIGQLLTHAELNPVPLDKGLIRRGCSEREEVNTLGIKGCKQKTLTELTVRVQ